MERELLFRQNKNPRRSALIMSYYVDECGNPLKEWYIKEREHECEYIFCPYCFRGQPKTDSDHCAICGKIFPKQVNASSSITDISVYRKADMIDLAAHPLPVDGFIGMEIRGDLLTDKENAGAALLDACKDVRNAEPIDVGSYRGFKMEVEFDIWERKLMLTLRGKASHRLELGSDPKGNLTRIENALARMPFRLTAAEQHLETLRKEQALAEKEIGKPFEFEAELAEKSARLVELNHALSLDKSPEPQEPDRKKNSHEEVR